MSLLRASSLCCLLSFALVDSIDRADHFRQCGLHYSFAVPLCTKELRTMAVVKNRSFVTLSTWHFTHTRIQFRNSITYECMW